MIPDPQGMTEAEILETTFLLDRTDIYRRFKCISELHTADKQHERLNGFFVGREYEVNADNLVKMDVQNFNTQRPKYFYSQYWYDKGRKDKDVRADFPLLFLTPGERSFLDPRENKRSSFNFGISVFDLQYYDRNNYSGNKTALREKEDIWTDTEKILLEVLEAYRDKDINAIYNLCCAGEYLAYPDDPGTWTPTQLSTAQALIKRIMISENFSFEFESEIIPIESKHNKRLAGVITVFSTMIFTGCQDGSFDINNKLC